MHRTRKAETTRPPASSTRAQQARFDRFRDEYNNVRPRDAIGQATPSTLYQPALRAFPRVLPELEYPDQFEICRTYPDGAATWRGTQWYLSGCLKNELVGFEEVDQRPMASLLGNILLDLLDVRRTQKRRNARNFGFRLDRGDRARMFYLESGTLTRRVGVVAYQPQKSSRLPAFLLFPARSSRGD